MAIYLQQKITTDAAAAAQQAAAAANRHQHRHNSSHLNSSSSRAASAAILPEPQCTAAAAADEDDAGAKPRPGAWESIKVLGRSLEIRCLAIMSLAQGLCNSLMEFAWKCHMRILYPSPADFTAFLGG